MIEGYASLGSMGISPSRLKAGHQHEAEIFGAERQQLGRGCSGRAPQRASIQQDLGEVPWWAQWWSSLGSSLTAAETVETVLTLRVTMTSGLVRFLVGGLRFTMASNAKTIDDNVIYCEDILRAAK